MCTGSGRKGQRSSLSPIPPGRSCPNGDAGPGPRLAESAAPDATGPDGDRHLHHPVSSHRSLVCNRACAWGDAVTLAQVEGVTTSGTKWRIAMELQSVGVYLPRSRRSFSRANGGRWRRQATDGGGRLHRGSLAPTTTLRVVPLPRKRERTVDCEMNPRRPPAFALCGQERRTKWVRFSAI